MKIIKFLLFVFFVNTYSNYETVKLASINLKQCIKIKEATQQKHSRTVYFDPDNQIYIKLWEPDYIYANFFLEATQTGFFKDISPLKNIIYDENNLCRGYITHRIHCELNNRLKFYSFAGALKLYDAYKQNEFYKMFLEKLKKKIKDYKVIYLDLVPDNIAFTCEEYYIIDLDAVVSFNNIEPLREIIDLDKILSYNPNDYQNFIYDLLKKETK